MRSTGQAQIHRIIRILINICHQTSLTSFAKATAVRKLCRAGRLTQTSTDTDRLNISGNPLGQKISSPYWIPAYKDGTLVGGGTGRAYFCLQGFPQALTNLRPFDKLKASAGLPANAGSLNNPTLINLNKGSPFPVKSLDKLEY